MLWLFCDCFGGIVFEDVSLNCRVSLEGRSDLEGKRMAYCLLPHILVYFPDHPHTTQLISLFSKIQIGTLLHRQGRFSSYCCHYVAK
jgi:hypothetical protein